MASVTASRYDIDDAEAGEIHLELVAIRYTGEQTLYDTRQHLEQAGWPSVAPLDGGTDTQANGSWNVALVADQYLAQYEGDPDIEVVYADQRERFAELILDIDDKPEQALENVFGRGADQHIQQRVFDALGIETVARAGPFEEQLRDIAGLDELEEVEEDPAVTSQLTDADEGYSRHELGDICKELRDGPDNFNLQENAGKTARAEYIATFDREARQQAIDAALGGDD